MRAFSLPVSLLLALAALPASAGIYSGPTDTANAIDGAIPSASPLFIEWASAIDPARTHFAPRGSTAISTTGFNSLGDLDATQIAASVSPGFLTVTFPSAIRDGAGADFAVFENGFITGGGLFAEYAYVEVSSNGTDFARFASLSTNTGPLSGTLPFAGFDVTNVYNLAGKHADGFGTPFDLSQLAADPLVTGGLLNLQNIQYVRLVDIPGNGAFLDSQGHPILDNWLTASPSGGYDFRILTGKSVGVLNAVSPVPEPANILLLTLGAAALLRRRR